MKGSFGEVAGRAEAEKQGRHQGVAFHVRDGHKGHNRHLHHMGKQPLHQHGVVHHRRVERKVAMELPHILEEVGGVAGEDLLGIKSHGPWSFELRPLRIKLIEVVGPVLNRATERHQGDSQQAELFRKYWAGVPGHLVAKVPETYSKARHGIEMAIDGLAREKNLHGSPKVLAPQRVGTPVSAWSDRTRPESLPC